MEDSLIVDDSFTTPVNRNQKRDSFLPSDGSSFVIKRRNLNDSVFGENSATNLSLNLSALNRSGVQNRDLSFQNCSIISGDKGSSLLPDTSMVNFDAISLSGINDSTSIMQIESEAPATFPAPSVNPEEMSYETLLRWEQTRGGVLDEKWKEIRVSVLKVFFLWFFYDLEDPSLSSTGYREGRTQRNTCKLLYLFL